MITTKTIFFIFIFIFISCDKESLDSRSINKSKINKFESNDSTFGPSPQKCPSELKDYEYLLKLDYQNKSIKSLDSIFNFLYVNDQIIRDLIVSIRLNNNADISNHLDLYYEMETKDSLNLEVLKKILEVRGWPCLKIFSEKSIEAPFLILLHNRKRTKELNSLKFYIEKSFENKCISSEHYATLIDAILLSNGKNQKFGTHCRLNNDKIFYYKILTKDIVNINRNQINLKKLDFNSCELQQF